MAENPRIATIPFHHPPQLIPSSSYPHPHPTLQPPPPKPKYPSFLDTPDVSPPARILCEILTKTPSIDLEKALTNSTIKPTSEITEEVLKLSYASPANAVTFFRWAGLIQKPTPFCWNIMVDLLGRNQMFEPMWDAVRSMKQENCLSISTFVSVFASYIAVGRINEAVMSFDVMERYGVSPDVISLNSLLSAICGKEKQTMKALEFFEKVKSKVAPDGDSFAILLEGWEKEGNVMKAKTTFGEMVIRVGWSVNNVAAYDAFLTTLIRGMQIDEAFKFLEVIKGKNCLPGLKFFSNALDILVKLNDAAHAVVLWDTMVGGGLVPNLIMYNAMIGLVCNNNDSGSAIQLLDGMVFQGAFPDSLTYNMIFQCLVHNKRVREVAKFFHEMVKNEWPPTHTNCAKAIALLFDGEDPETAFEIWEYMIKNRVLPIDDSSNALLIGLAKMGRVAELRRCVENMLDRRIRISESTMVNLKVAFYKEGRSTRETYDDLLQKWKSS